jgi:sialate O-acetylesterase
VGARFGPGGVFSCRSPSVHFFAVIIIPNPLKKGSTGTVTRESMLTKPNLALPALAILSATALRAEVKPNPLFTDGAVLQRGQVVPVWGTARDGETITVEFAGQTVTTTATGGKWRVNLAPLKQGGPFTMTLTGDNTVTLRDLLVGEVWICSGQSNMEWPFSAVHNAQDEGPKADYPQIRMFTVPRTVAIPPQSEANGTWVTCSPHTVTGFSGVGYFFARDIHQKLGVPVGMIHSSVGGTPAQAWTSREGFGSHPELQGYAHAVHQKLAAYQTALAAYESSIKERQRATPHTSGPAEKEPTAPAPFDYDAIHPASLFHGMIHPLIPYRIAGVIWYQGESNAWQSQQYRTLFPALIADWRAHWNIGDFPFLYVQIAPFQNQPPEIREAQLLTLSKANNTAMVVTTDVGDAHDIHPNRKEPVGQRLALAARALAYGEKIEYSGPLFDSMKVEGTQAILTFRHTGTGLIAKDGALKGFIIAGENNPFIPATAEIQGNTVVVSAEGITTPIAVRYGWANVPDVNLYNREGLPAYPFRTDVE